MKETQPATDAAPAAAPRKETYTQINLPAAPKQEKPQQPQRPAVAETPAPAVKVAPAKKAMAHPANIEETFQMLAATPLEKLAANAKSMFYNPSLDNSSPNVTLRSGGSMAVLKSGISQKVTQVDLTIGKAEVIYLSRPAARVAVSNPDIASAVVISPTQIQLVGKGVGVANLLVWGDMVSPDHTVVDVSVHRDVSVLTNQLKYVDPGIQVIPMAAEDTVILTGEAATRESAQLAIEMAKAFFSKNGGTTGAAANSSPNSQAPGSALPGVSSNIINLIKVKDEPSTKIELVRQKLHDIDPNIAIDVVPGPEGTEKVILTGRVATASIASKALNMASVFYGQPGMKMVTVQGGNEPSRLQASASSSSGGSSNATSTPSSASANMLQGSVMTDATGNVISMLEIAQKPQIRCSIKILEVNKNKLNALGGTLTGVRGASKLTSLSGSQSPAPGKAISQVPDTVKVGGYDGAPGAIWGNSATRGSTGASSWNPTAQGFAQAFGNQYLNGVTQVFSINNTLAGAIQALQDKSMSRTLAEPTLTMMSGEQGSFLAGGEIPVAFLGGNGQISIEYKEYGIRLNLLPNVTDDGKIQMQVAPEISTIDRSVTVQGVPGLLTRRMSTNLLLEPGQSFVLAGIFKQEDAESASGLPGVSKLPIIGSFFRNKWKTGANTEMIVLVKPEIIPSTTGSTGMAAQPPAAEKPATQISRIYESEK
jgi:Flp pilus assembly secretin CpaC